MKCVPADLSAIFFNQLFENVLGTARFKTSDKWLDVVVLERPRHPRLAVRVSTEGSLTLFMEDTVRAHPYVLFTNGLLGKGHARLKPNVFWVLRSTLSTYRNLNLIIKASY